MLVGVVGPVAWLIAGRATAGGSRLALPGSRDPSAPPRTLAPDDDPEFLGRLGSHNAYDRQLDEWEEELRNRTGDEPADGDNPTTARTTPTGRCARPAQPTPA